MVDYTVLANLINIDPDGIGFAPYVNVSDTKIADMFNDINGPGKGNVTVATMSRGKFLRGIIAATDQLASNTALSPAIVNKLVYRFNALRSGDTDIPIDATMQALLQDLVTDSIVPQAAVTNFLTRVGSYAEVKFGADTAISWRDVAKALGRIK